MGDKRRQRRRYTDAFKRQVVAESFDPDVSVAETARRHQMNANALFNWRKDPRFNTDLAECASPEVEPVFLRVEIDAEEHSLVEPATVSTPSVTQPSPTSAIEIALVCGTRLRVESNVEEAALTRVIRAIGAAA
ncbi:transposase [Maricaulis sp.]|uniref:IS66-like element accessory protein TnpA n=1 Tax=Maricaulis sp. TaxID=1486257 RepID=UPI001B01759A|nr:transposase [Maricaulis sp.]MBO6798473.1 transposase [Maricaulis sp.]